MHAYFLFIFTKRDVLHNLHRCMEANSFLKIVFHYFVTSSGSFACFKMFKDRKGRTHPAAHPPLHMIVDARICDLLF